MDYVTVESATVTADIKRSEFITEIRRVRSEEELFAELGKLKKQYSDATHICYGAIFDKTGNSARFSDDGEPGGTAGAPIMDALKNSGLKETLVAVVRYFGGIKLGAGGLVRAYSQSASEGIKAVNKISCALCDIYSLDLDFSRAKKAPVFFEKNGIEVVGVEYGQSVKYDLAVSSGRSIDELISQFVSGKPNLTLIEKRYIEKKIN
ncbi:MAG: YigZ family protein [Clostridia bacterium]|nr:YigZ family protein [Clostridia bacterium]